MLLWVKSRGKTLGVSSANKPITERTGSPGVSAKNEKIQQNQQKLHRENQSMMYIPCPGQGQCSPPHTENSGMRSPVVSAKNGKMHVKSAKIAQREGKRHPGMVPIPFPGQVQLSPPHTENLGMGSPGVSAKYGKMHPNQQILPR